jgi:hypothetical protein
MTMDSAEVVKRLRELADAIEGEPDREPEDEAPESPPDPTPGPPQPEVLEQDHGRSYVIVIGKDKALYPGAPASFKTALRAETWLQKHLAEQEGALLKGALAVFHAGGLAEAKKPEDERNWDEAFARASGKFTPSFVEDNYAELSAEFAEGWDKALE